MIEVSDEIKTKVKARLQATSNLGKVIWVERGEEGEWYVHANLGRETDRRMQAAHQARRFYALAAEVLK